MTPQDIEAIRAKLEQQLLALANLWRGRAEWQQGAPGAEAQVGRCADDLVASLPGLLSSLTEAGGGADVRQVAAEMRHFGRLLRSRDVMPTPDTMADRLAEWAEELFGAQPSPADGKAQEPMCKCGHGESAHPFGVRCFDCACAKFSPTVTSPTPSPVEEGQSVHQEEKAPEKS